MGSGPHPPCLAWSPRLPAHRPHSEDEKALTKALPPPCSFERASSSLCKPLAALNAGDRGKQEGPRGAACATQRAPHLQLLGALARGGGVGGDGIFSKIFIHRKHC